MQLQQEREAKKAAQAAEAARIKAKQDRAAQLKAIQDAQQLEIQKKKDILIKLEGALEALEALEPDDPAPAAPVADHTEAAKVLGVF